jgi:opacity protein-like surface antigen
MRTFVFVGVLILGLSLVAAAADDAPTAQVFGGISWLHTDNMGASGIAGSSLKSNYFGWDSEFQWNMNKWLGLTADIGGNYGHLIPDAPTSHFYTFVFGPTLSHRGRNSTIFAHTLFGGNNANLFSSVGSSSGDTAFAMAWGGGIDLKINDTFALRLGQLDWLYTRHDLTSVSVGGVTLRDHQNNIRYAGGITINLGRH